jgi:ABC-type branched-subunit amino acid transport system substrate-binding protein
MPALTAVSDAGVPVVAPYLRTTETLPDGVFVTGPSEEAIADGLSRAMETDEVTSPITIVSDDVPAPSVGAAPPRELTGSGLDDLVEDIAKAVEDKTADSIVISASAASQATTVAALQGAVPDVPVYLTPEATTPAFASALRDGSGTPAGRFVSVGPRAFDSSTLDSSPEAESAAAYFAALRLGAADESFTSALDDSPFADVSGAADLPSHDAVLALVRAAAKAESTDPAEVGAALDGLTVGVKGSLAGPALDFSSSYALPAEAVVPLYATTQDPGVRPAASTPVLNWFGLPGDSQ